MSKLKFRGLRIDGNGWVYGYYVYRPDGKHLIYWKPFEESSQNTYHIVDPKTVGQFTGLLDCNGKDIFEGDIIEWKEAAIRFRVTWSLEDCGFICIRVWQDNICSGSMNQQYLDHFQIIGNIHENKNLLEQDK